MQRELFRLLSTIAMVFLVLDLLALPATDWGSAPFYAALFGAAILVAFIAVISWEFRREIEAGME